MAGAGRAAGPPTTFFVRAATGARKPDVNSRKSNAHMLIDTHCHLDFPDFAPEQAEIVARARARGVGRMITISTHLSRFDRVKAVAEAYPEVFCTVGTHPHHPHEEEEPTVEELVALSRHPKCVGLGEAGLDY